MTTRPFPNVAGTLRVPPAPSGNIRFHARSAATATASDRPRGFTLLEIILALAILAGSLAALGEVMRLADQNAAMTRDETQLQIVASSVMDELISGARTLTAVSHASYDPELDPQLVYSVTVEQTAYEELLEVRVLVEQQIDARLQPARYELVRWIINPEYVPAETGGAP